MGDDLLARGKLMVKRFQRSNQVSSPLIYSDLGYWCIIWKVNTTNMGLNLKNTMGGKFVCCLIIVVIFVGLWRAYRLGEILKLSYRGKATKGWGHLYGGSWPLKTPCKDFNLAIVGGLGWMKWLKNGAGKCLYFMQLFLHYIFFGENFIG